MVEKSRAARRHSLRNFFRSGHCGRDQSRQTARKREKSAGHYSRQRGALFEHGAVPIRKVTFRRRFGTKQRQKGNGLGVHCFFVLRAKFYRDCPRFFQALASTRFAAGACSLPWLWRNWPVFTDKNRVRMKILVYDIKGSGMMPEQSGEMKWKW